MTAAILDDDTPDFVVVGSGAGGGTLAARLAENGFRVTVLEAGGDPCKTDAPGLPEHYDVPAFHALSSENPAMSWDFFVHHYKERPDRDGKYVAAHGGVLYPRAGTLGGCTAHNAMIMVSPHNSDWDSIAEATGDASWASGNMRSYFERLENCQYRPGYRLEHELGFNPTRHGWDGWLHTETAIPLAALADRNLVKVLKDSAAAAFAEVGRPDEQIRELIEGEGDPNDWRVVSENGEGLRYTPLATNGHKRMGTRERLIDVSSRMPDRLRIITHALATKVIFDGTRAVGVEYLSGANLYRADKNPSADSGELRQIRCSREVILCGGAFNTPQLLMLSGIGPAAELAAHRIPALVALEGVGRNLQDRYEIGVVNRMNFPKWSILEGAEFRRGDPLFQQWQNERTGVYTTNGAVLAVITKSAAERELPDLLSFALLSRFYGYFPGYSKELAEKQNYLTWAILKAHTENRGGVVTLRSADPRDVPEINFNYFEDGTDAAAGKDLDSVVAGIRLARGMTKALKADGHIAEEELPGETLQTDDELRAYVNNNAWGHHASCTCPIGAREKGGVLSSDFRVHGTTGLRVVDASAFPRIPGFFIVCAVYMIAEKAADVIGAAHGRG